jgi:hypothetical protein
VLVGKHKNILDVLLAKSEGLEQAKAPLSKKYFKFFSSRS